MIKICACICTAAAMLYIVQTIALMEITREARHEAQIARGEAAIDEALGINKP